MARRGSWSLKARFTIPADAPTGTIERTVAALTALPWAWQPQPGSDTNEAVVASD